MLGAGVVGGVQLVLQVVELRVEQRDLRVARHALHLLVAAHLDVRQQVVQLGYTLQHHTNFRF